MPLTQLNPSQSAMFQELASQVYVLLQKDQDGVNKDSGEQLQAQIRRKLVEIGDTQRMMAEVHVEVAEERRLSFPYTAELALIAYYLPTRISSISRQSDIDAQT